MRVVNVLAAIASALVLTAPAAAQPPPVTDGPSSATEPSMGDVLPFIGDLLDHRRELGLSAAQIESLDRLGLDLLRETIRRQSELMLAQLDAAALLRTGDDPGKAVNLADTEGKLRQIERIKTDLQLALLRAIEAAKAQLTADQRAKLPAVFARGETANPGPAGPSRPSGHGAPAPPTLHSAPPRVLPAPRVEPRRDGHAHGGMIGGAPFWWQSDWMAPPPVSYWYYCQSAGAYYPYVTWCPEGWVPVRAR